MKLSGYIVLVVIMALLACSDDDGPINPGPGPGSTCDSNRFTVNGDGIPNNLVEPFQCSATYNEGNDRTSITLTGSGGVVGSVTYILTLTTPGNETGTFQWTNSVGGEGTTIADLLVTVEGDTRRYFSDRGNTHITLYGEVDERIIGSFEGSASRDNGGKVDISGIFSAHRQK